METLETKVRINGIVVVFTRHPTTRGAVVVSYGVAGTESFDMQGDDDTSFAMAMPVALTLYGARRSGLRTHTRPNCSNSEVHEIWRLMQQVAGV